MRNTSVSALSAPLSASGASGVHRGTPWNVSTSWRRGTVTLTPGTELSVRGIRGRVKFRQHVTLPDGRTWIDVVHPEFGFHSVRPERVRVVHRAKKARPVRATTRVSRAAVAA